MIVTLTLNPSLDRTFALDRLERGGVNRVRHSTAEAAGKGVNVARALAANGFDATAVLPLGGSTGLEMTRLLETNGPPFVAVEITGQTRANVTVMEDDGTVTKLNEPGARLEPAELSRLMSIAIERVDDGGWIVAAGSLPPGVDSGVYARFVTEARAAGARIAVDASGPALTAAVGAGPDLVKPNLPELEELTGQTIRTLGEAASASRALLGDGPRMVLTSLGADGALLCTGDEILHGTSAAAEVANTVGAGDTLLAGFLAGSQGGGSSRDALTEALVWARAAIRSPLTTMQPPSQDDRAAVEIAPEPDAAAVLMDQ